MFAFTFFPRQIGGHDDDVNSVVFVGPSSQIVLSGADDGLCKVRQLPPPPPPPGDETRRAVVFSGFPLGAPLGGLLENLSDQGAWTTADFIFCELCLVNSLSIRLELGVKTSRRVDIGPCQVVMSPCCMEWTCFCLFVCFFHKVKRNLWQS